MDGMKPVASALQTPADIESETRALILAEAPSKLLSETAAEIVPLIEKIGATSIGEIEKLIGDTQEAKTFLQSEAERIQRETARYTKLAQTASASIEIWHRARMARSRPPRRQSIDIERTCRALA